MKDGILIVGCFFAKNIEKHKKGAISNLQPPVPPAGFLSLLAAGLELPSPVHPLAPLNTHQNNRNSPPSMEAIKQNSKSVSLSFASD